VRFGSTGAAVGLSTRAGVAPGAGVDAVGNGCTRVGDELEVVVGGCTRAGGAVSFVGGDVAGVDEDG
jgi:hypothetical protein